MKMLRCAQGKIAIVGTGAALLFGVNHEGCRTSCATPPKASSTNAPVGPVGAVGPVVHPSVPFWLESRARGWDQPAPMHATSALPDKIKVVVIGAGLSGTGCAYSLAQHGIPTLLLDARGVAGGATGRNGGFLGGATWSQLPVMLLEKPPLCAVQTIRLKSENLRLVRQLCDDLDVDADMDRGVDGVSFFPTEQSLNERVGWWRHLPKFFLALFGVEIYIGAEEMGRHIRLRSNIDSYGCVRLRRDFDTFSAARFVEAVAKHVASRGTQVQTHTRVLRVAPAADGDGHMVYTDRGHVVRCESVVFATNAYTGCLLPALADKIRPVRNHVMVTSPCPPILRDGSRGGFGHNSGFNYWIQREDGRIVLGGFRDKERANRGVDEMDDSDDDPLARSVIRTFLRDHFDFADAEGPITKGSTVAGADGPITNTSTGADVTAVDAAAGAFRIEQEWTGILGWSCDDAPWVGPMPGQPGVFVCAGFCGSGLSRAFICGAAVGDMVAGDAPRCLVDSYMPNLDRQWTADVFAGHAVTPGTRRIDRRADDTTQ